MLKNKLNLQIAASVCAAISGLLFINIASAVDIPIESYVEGGLTLSTSGDWNTGLVLSGITYSSNEETVFWEGVAADDYISFVDDSSTDGFHISIDSTNFIYTGYSTSQSDLAAANLKIIGRYNGSSATTSNMGLDDDSYTLSILPDSCSAAESNLGGKYTLHSELTTADYSLVGSTSSSVLLESNVNCLVQGHLRFDRIELTIPENSKVGSYSGTINLTIIDGQV